MLVQSGSNSSADATNAYVDAAVAAAVAHTIGAGAGLTGGGAVSSNPTVNVIANADGSIVANANDLQVGVLASDAQHGTRGGGTVHANAVASGAAGFLTGTDKAKLDGIASGAQVCSIANVKTAFGTLTDNITFGSTLVLAVNNSTTTVSLTANIINIATSNSGNITASGLAIMGYDGRQFLGFFGVANVGRPSALTQTYSTSTRTHANITAVAVATTGAALASYGFTQAQADALVAAVNALIVDMANVKQFANVIADDLQLFGLEA